METSAQSSVLPHFSVLWQVRSPAEAQTNEKIGSIPDWLEAIRSLRGSVLYAGGRRPQFKTVDGQYYDSDPIDVHCYHMLAYQDHQLVGCVRVYPLVAHTPQCVTEKLLGREAFAQMLLELGGRQATTIEFSRWVVHPDYRKVGLSMPLAAGACAIGRHLGFPLAVASAGTGDMQDQILAHMGFKAVPTVDLLPSDLYKDWIRVMYVSGHNYSPDFVRSMDQMAQVLRLNEASLFSQ